MAPVIAFMSLIFLGWGGLRHIFFRKTCIIFRDFQEKLVWFYQCFPKIWSGTSVKANVKQLKDLLFVSYNFCIKHLHQEVTYKILKRLVSRGMFITHSNILRSSFFCKALQYFHKNSILDIYRCLIGFWMHIWSGANKTYIKT